MCLATDNTGENIEIEGGHMNTAWDFYCGGKPAAKYWYAKI
jgi:hypothetical protein